MSEEERICEILSTIQKIKESKQPVRGYFKQNSVPFSRAQYYTYCKTLQKYGEEGLRDKRKDGNYTKLKERIKGYVVSTVEENRSMPSSQLQGKILNQFDVKISESCLNNFRASVSLTRLPAPKEEKYERNKSGGGEILTCLAFFTHIIEIYTKTIIERVNEVRQSPLFKQNKSIGEDHLDIRSHGKFTREYNQLKSVREKRFRSIDDKIRGKNFDRWPMQEKQFRDGKSGVNIHRIVGYGMKIENYEKMDEKHGEICKTITQLKSRLEKPLQEIEAIEVQLAHLYRQERAIREKSTIVDGKRVLSEADSMELQQCEARINKCLRQQKTIEKEHKDDFKRLKSRLKEEKRIRGKDKVYRIDTELDQIMTCFKLSFVNLCSLFLTKCLDREKFELLTLFESIFQLGGDALARDGEKIIGLEMNPKEPELMDKLDKALRVLNTMNIYDPDGRSIQFDV